MIEKELRKVFIEATQGKILRGFWHTKFGKELRKQIDLVFFNDFETLQQKIWSLEHNISIVPKCVICNKRASFYKYSFLKTCGINCGSTMNIRDQQNRGIFNISKGILAATSEEAKIKRKSTLFNTYQLNGENIRANIEKTNIEKYGKPHPLQVKSIIEKVASTNLKKIGYSSALASPIIRTKIKESKRRIYEIEVFPTRLKIIKEENKVLPLFSKYLGAEELYDWHHIVCGKTFQSTLIDGIKPFCTWCKPKSKQEVSIINICDELKLSYKINDRTLIKPYELDILIPDNNLAIEVNGVYWHQSDGTNLSLLDKTKMVENKGFQVLHFWDYEIKNKLHIIHNIINAKIGVLPNKIGARKCLLKVVSKNEAVDFLNNYHLQGSTNSPYRLGLYFNNELIALSTFSKPRFSNESGIELTRFVVKNNWSVPGALSKLISAAYKEKQLPIISYADRRISTGAAYKKIGFKFLSQTAPNYFYIKGNKIINRYGAMKHKLPKLLGASFSMDLTEKENMIKAGWMKFSDCGNIKFIYSKAC